MAASARGGRSEVILSRRISLPCRSWPRTGQPDAGAEHRVLASRETRLAAEQKLADQAGPFRDKAQATTKLFGYSGYTIRSLAERIRRCHADAAHVCREGHVG
jgi:hypothetical protein